MNYGLLDSVNDPFGEPAQTNVQPKHFFSATGTEPVFSEFGQAGLDDRWSTLAIIATRTEVIGVGETKLVTAASLRSQTSKDLAQLAKSKGIPGWHSMRKEQLVHALLKSAKKKTTTKAKSVAKKPTKASASDSRIARKLRQERIKNESLKNLALVNERERLKEEPESDRLIAIVRDPYWIQAYWEITKTTVERVRVAMADCWFETKPVLRLLEITSDANSSGMERIVKEIPIHGGVRNWYLDVPDPPKTYRIALGYASNGGKFYLIAKSNQVTTPTPDHEAFDNNWADISDNYKKFYAMSGGYNGYETTETETELQSVFEEKLRRPMNVPAFVRLGSGLNQNGYEFEFTVDAYMVIEGSANPTANVTLAGEPLKLRDDGTFTVKMDLPERRQVLPIVASSRDGTQQRTTVLAIERNTKVMEPISKELDEV